MNERTWNLVVWIGIIGTVGAVIATFSSYLIMKESSIAIIFFVIAVLFAIVAAVANVGATRTRQSRYSGELAAQQQRVDDLFASARSDGKHLGPQERAMAAQAAAEGESLAEEEAEHERAEHGNWELLDCRLYIVDCGLAKSVGAGEIRLGAWRVRAGSTRSGGRRLGWQLEVAGQGCRCGSM